MLIETLRMLAQTPEETAAKFESLTPEELFGLKALVASNAASLMKVIDEHEKEEEFKYDSLAFKNFARELLGRAALIYLTWAWKGIATPTSQEDFPSQELLDELWIFYHAECDGEKEERWMRNLAHKNFLARCDQHEQFAKQNYGFTKSLKTELGELYPEYCRSRTVFALENNFIDMYVYGLRLGPALADLKALNDIGL